MLELAFVIMGPPMPCRDEILHWVHIKKWLKDRVFPCCDLESTPNVVHQGLVIAKQLKEKAKNCKGIFGAATANENDTLIGKTDIQFTTLNHICTDQNKSMSTNSHKNASFIKF